MPIEFACEHCSRTLRVPDGSSGRQSQCPACHHVQQVPGVVGGNHSAPKAASDRAAGVAGSTGATADNRLSIACPKCKHLLRCTPDLLGTRGQCRQCQHIFTISLNPGQTQAVAPVRLVFSCPQCHQLFEGREDMRGRTGKCHACHAVFKIALRPASKSQDNDAQAASSTAANPSPASQRPQSAGAAGAPRPAKGEPAQPSSPQPQPKAGPFKVPGAAKNPAAGGAAAATPQVARDAAVQHPAALQQRTGRTLPPAASVQHLPIQFTCSQCHGLMEVPGTSAGMETACPYCQTVQTIPANSQQQEEHAPPEPSALAFDPLAEFSASPAAMQQQWSAQSFGRHRSGLTFGNVFQTAFENLFPSSLFCLLHALIAGVYSAVGLGVTFGTLLWLKWLGLSPQAMIISLFVCFGLFAIISVFVAAWFSASLRHMALRAVRKMPLDIGQALSPGGAYSVAVLLTFLTFLFNVLLRLPAIIENMSPNTLGWMGVVWVVVLLPIIAIVNMFLSMAWFAAMDGDSTGEALGISCRLVLKNLPLMIGVKLLVWLMTVVLAVLTLGFALILPIYFNATLYHLARKQQGL